MLARVLAIVLVAALAAGCTASDGVTTSSSTSTSTFPTTAPTPPRLVHWHAKWEVFVNDQRLNFDNFADVSRNYHGQLYLPAHLHSPTTLIHNEGREGQGTMGSLFLYHLGGKLAADGMVLPSGVLPTSGDYKVDADHALQMLLDPTPYAQQVNGTSAWRKVDDLANYSFHNGDRILLVYGNDTPERVTQLEAQFPTFDPTAIK